MKELLYNIGIALVILLLAGPVLLLVGLENFIALLNGDA